MSASILTADGVRRVSGAIDLLLLTKEGAVTVDHKSFPGDSSRWKAKAAEYAPQMGAYARVLEAAGHVIAGQWIHFTVGAGAVKLE